MFENFPYENHPIRKYGYNTIQQYNIIHLTKYIIYNISISFHPKFHAYTYNNNPFGVTRGRHIYIHTYMIIIEGPRSGGISSNIDSEDVRRTFHNVVYNTICTIKTSIFIIIIIYLSSHII